VGREKKGQAAFSPLVLSHGSEEVGKTGTKRLPSGLAKSVRMRRIGVEGVARLPQGLEI